MSSGGSASGPLSKPTRFGAKDRRRGGRGGGYDGELASSILLEDCDSTPNLPPADGMQLYGPLGIEHPPLFPPTSPFFSGGIAEFAGESLLQDADRGGKGSAHGADERGLNFGRRANNDVPNRTPTRTPSPVYHWNHPKKVSAGEETTTTETARNKSSSSTSKGETKRSYIGADSVAHISDTQLGGQGGCSDSIAPALASQLNMPSPFLNPYWALPSPQGHPQTALNPLQAQAYYGLMLGGAHQLVASQQAFAAMSMQAAAAVAASGGVDGKSMPPTGFDSNMMQAFMSGHMQASTGSSALTPGSINAAVPATVRVAETSGPPKSLAAATSSLQEGIAETDFGGGDQWPDAVAVDRDRGKARKKKRNKLDKSEAFTPSAIEPPAVLAVGPVPPNAAGAPLTPGNGESAGVKTDRRSRRGGSDQSEDARGSGSQGGAAGGKGGRRSENVRVVNPLIESLKARDRQLELVDLASNISEIAKDQYGSRLIQQKLEVASDEAKQVAFVAVLQKMPQLTTDVFGNYVIQKFFEYGSIEQRRILCEQLVGQVMPLSLQMYGCRVVQKALDSVAIEQQMLLVGELKGHVLQCIEDQHGNHVIQKCIERLPTDQIGFIVEALEGQVSRMAKHCYGCRVIQRLIEYCSSYQISNLLDEVLTHCTELAADQYGNYVVQHVMEHSSRLVDRIGILHIFRQNILTLSCHKYSSNVVEKALSCSTMEERASMISAIIGDGTEAHPPLITMMRDRFGNYIVQRSIALAQGPVRDQLIWKLSEQMPALKKSNTYGKHIIAALEK